MAWCHQATSHYLNQNLPNYVLLYGITRLQWVKTIFNLDQFSFSIIHHWFSCQSNILAWDNYSDPFVNAPSQWETTLQCNVVSHWLGSFTKWSLNWYISVALDGWCWLRMVWNVEMGGVVHGNRYRIRMCRFVQNIIMCYYHITDSSVL